MDEFNKQFIKQFQCFICFEILLNPVKVECGHSFCQDCLNKWFTNFIKTSTNPKLCPECEHPISWKKAYEDELQRYAISNDNLNSFCNKQMKIQEFNKHWQSNCKTCKAEILKQKERGQKQHKQILSKYHKSLQDQKQLLHKQVIHCQNCQQKFPNFVNLLIHLIQIHKEDPGICPICIQNSKTEIDNIHLSILKHLNNTHNTIIQEAVGHLKEEDQINYITFMSQVECEQHQNNINTQKQSPFFEEISKANTFPLDNDPQILLNQLSQDQKPISEVEQIFQQMKDSLTKECKQKLNNLYNSQQIEVEGIRKQNQSLMKSQQNIQSYQTKIQNDIQGIIEINNEIDQKIDEIENRITESENIVPSLMTFEDLIRLDSKNQKLLDLICQRNSIQDTIQTLLNSQQKGKIEFNALYEKALKDLYRNEFKINMQLKGAVRQVQNL